MRKESGINESLGAIRRGERRGRRGGGGGRRGGRRGGGGARERAQDDVDVGEVLGTIADQLEVGEEARDEVDGEPSSGGEGGEEGKNLCFVEGEKEDFATNGFVDGCVEQAHGGEDSGDVESARGE